jgi:hypothetical protein
MVDWVHTIASQTVIMVESIRRAHAIVPIDLVFGSFDLKYSEPFHLVTKIKQMSGKIMLNAYNSVCARVVVERGA